MSEKVLIISTSLRAGSNSDILAKECEKGARDAGLDAEYISLKDYSIGFCKGCLACQKTGECVIKDDAASIMEKMKNAYAIVFATPIYYYEMSGQMKTLLDRMNPMYGTEYAFRKVYMIATAADDGSHTFERAYNGLGGWVECFDKAELSGLVEGGAIENPNDAADHSDVMKKAYELGKNISNGI